MTADVQMLHDTFGHDENLMSDETFAMIVEDKYIPSPILVLPTSDVGVTGRISIQAICIVLSV